jgi:hypothetical protein
MLYKQEELTYAEDAAVKNCISKLAEITSGNISLVDALGKIYDAGVAEELFGIILKRHEPTIFHRGWNFAWAQYHGINLSPQLPGIKSKPVISILKNSEVMEVLADFFVLNTSWMKGLEHLNQASTSRS